MAIPTKNQTAKTTADAIFNHFKVHYGIPATLHSDQGAQFEGNIIRELCDIMDVRKSRTTPISPDVKRNYGTHEPKSTEDARHVRELSEGRLEETSFRISSFLQLHAAGQYWIFTVLFTFRPRTTITRRPSIRTRYDKRE